MALVNNIGKSGLWAASDRSFELERPKFIVDFRCINASLIVDDEIYVVAIFVRDVDIISKEQTNTYIIAPDFFKLAQQREARFWGSREYLRRLILSCQEIPYVALGVANRYFNKK